MIVKPRTPSGFPEYLPGEQIEFNRLLGIVRDTYELYGFSPLDTPDVELSEILFAKTAGETAKEVYQIEKGRNSLTMRFDLTVPLARYAAQHEHELVFPFRRYHIGKVHRAERAQAGRFREFYQCDIDVIGSESPIVDAEFPAVINEIFEQFNFGEFTIRVNNRKILNGFFEALGLVDKATDVLRLVDKIEKLSSEQMVAAFEKEGLSSEQIDSILSFVTVTGDNDEVVGKLKELGINSELFDQGVRELEILVGAMRQMGVPEKRFKVDLKIARGLDYYTGTVYETILNDHPGVGSVCSGGRFDNLAEYYTDTKLPGVGISIGLTRLFYKLREAGIIEVTRESPSDIVVLPLSDEQIGYGLEVSALLRQAGISVLHYTEPNAIKQKLRYANKMGFKYALLLGSQEAEGNTVAVKDMTTGETSQVDKTAVVDFLTA